MVTEQQSAPDRAGFGWRLPLYVARAVWLLAWARLAMGRVPLDQLRQVSAVNPVCQRGAGGEVVDVVSRVIPQVACWVPWRSDCLVQALAGQRWLASTGIASQIEIGVASEVAEGFASHAWLRSGGQVVIGGAVSRYAVILGADDQSA